MTGGIELADAASAAEVTLTSPDTFQTARDSVPSDNASPSRY